MFNTSEAQAMAYGLAGFVVSAALILFVSTALAARWGASGAARFWVILATSAAQLGAIAVLLSLFHALMPVPFLALQAVLVVATLMIGGRPRSVIDLSHARSLAANPLRLALLVTIVLIVIGHVVLQAKMPLVHFDDRMYRASRAAYWLEHHSLLPWETHNDRQIAFPLGSELVFFWPVMFTRSEVVGRTVFGLVAPLCAAGLYLVLREARISRGGALAGVLLLMVTPVVARTFGGLSPESWLALYVLGVAFFSLRAARLRGRVAWHFVMTGLFVALAMNVKTTAIALVPLALVLPWLLVPRGAHTAWSRVKAVVVGGATGAVLSGIGFTTVVNLVREGHPLGPPGMVAIHAANISPRELRTHAARFLVAMIDAPVIPSATVRKRLTEAARSFLALCDADQPLTLERGRGTWPGRYEVDIGHGSTRFSTGGLIWIPALVAALVGVVADAVARRGRGRLGAGGVLAIESLALLAFTVLTIRWMGLGERFWVAAYAVGMGVIALEVRRSTRSRPWLRYVAALALVVTVAPAVRELWRALSTPAPPIEVLNEPFAQTLRHVPPGSRILLIASGPTRDYPLFAPREGFANTVISWGSGQFDPQRMRALLTEQRITHVVLENDVRVLQSWRPSVATAEMVRWLRNQMDWMEVPRDQTSGQLFVRAGEPSGG